MLMLCPVDAVTCWNVASVHPGREPGHLGASLSALSAVCPAVCFTWSASAL